MNNETPLTEVATHLPRAGAAVLTTFSYPVQSAVLVQIREIVVHWEEHGYVFDPIAYEATLEALCKSLGPAYDVVEKYFELNAMLKAQLAKADSLIEELGEHIARLAMAQQAEGEKS